MRANFLILNCLLAILCSCTSKQEEANEPATTEAIAMMAPAVAQDKELVVTSIPEASSNNFTKQKKIIKDGSITFKTDNINTSKKGIDDLLKKLQAYYETEDLQNNDEAISYNLKIRVPSANFEKLISTLENGNDEIQSKNIQARDVTEEFVDIETRLANKRDYLKRYKELLSRAQTVKDILAVEENIRILQEEIESKEGRLKYLSDQVALSTLNIHLFKEKESTGKYQDSFLGRTKTSFKNGWASIVDLVLWAIGIWPYLITATVAFFITRRIIKTRKNK